MTARRVGILGGTFDPIHCGHLDLGRAAQAALHLTEVVVITAHHPPHRPPTIASSFHRFAMCALAVVERSGWRVSDLELSSGGPSFTTNTLQALAREGYLPTELYFVIGADAFADIASWKDYPALLDRSHFVAVSRPGFPIDAVSDRLGLATRIAPGPSDERAHGQPSIFLIDAPTTDVSSTAIRRRRADGESIVGLVPPLVQHHIEQHALYRTTTRCQPTGGAAAGFAADRLHGQD